MSRNDPGQGTQFDGAGTSNSNRQSGHSSMQEINGRLASLDAEIEGLVVDMEQMRVLHSRLVSERHELLQQLNALQQRRTSTNSRAPGRTTSTDHKIDYSHERFDWSGELKARMKKVFSIENFRLCQEGVCNANMDGRDIVCVMPTGGGKSLTYQLPALMNPGCTLVISPLISLITDQILHLREAGVEAVMLTGATSKEQSQEIMSKLLQTAGGKAQKGFESADRSAQKEIKLCYVTPEKIAKSKNFTSMLTKLAAAGKLARIVIDEAHCVSQLGHDFRPDYKKLSLLRQLFPRVPILALSATCPPKVLKDLVMTLRLKAVVDGNSANTDGTVYFSAPLYRKNLHYKILPKSASASAAIQNMAVYILKEHNNDSGIVYCLSKKDAETVASGIMTASGGSIKTGVYHADVRDHDKEELHRRWRRGKIQVVCATIAFGLGIDKGNVRFVLHHSMSKSLDGYYQESGRAGRDGQDADCILYYRPQDATRLSSLICGELEGQEKLYDMLRFAQDIDECRKLQFAKYFSASSSLSMSAWGTDEASAVSPCGHCDNCTRPEDSIERKDVTLDAWRILRVAAAIEQQGGRVTLGMLGDLVRGAGGGTFGVSGGGGRKGKSKEKVGLDLDSIANGKVSLSKDDTETLLVHLMLSHFLKESFNSTAYAINVYVQPGTNALRLTRQKYEDIQRGNGMRINLAFIKKSGKKGNKKVSNASDDRPTASRSSAKRLPRKRKRTMTESNGEIDDMDSGSVANDSLDVLMQEVKHGHRPDTLPGRQSFGEWDEGDGEENDDEILDWTFTMHGTSGQADKSHGNNLSNRLLKEKQTSQTSTNDDVVILSSDSD